MNSPVAGNNVRVDSSAILLPVVCLYSLTIAAQFIGLAFGRANEEQSFSSIVLPSLVFLSVLTLPACWAGIVLGRQVGLDTPRIAAPVSKQPGSGQKVRNDFVVAGGLGLLLGGLLLVLRVSCQPYLPPELPPLGYRGVLGGLSVSLGAAVGEEVWFRLGLMTALVWIVARLEGDRIPSPMTVWLVIVLSSICFGAAHLPQLASHGAGSPIAVGATVIGNVVVGTLYGWLYWRRGLFAAMISHFLVDLVLHVLSAPIAGWLDV
jgi:membrane protease YdiL (CAAX protease family)